MADIIVKVDTAVVVPVNILPLIDDTDFKSIETAVAYNAAGIALTWNFVTPAGATSGTAVTPTTGGVYDWSEPIADKGMYAIEIPASGGASINNDTEGVGWFSGVATGVLPWRGPTIQFSPANVVDSLVTGSDLLDVSLVQILGTALTETAGQIAAAFKKFFNIATPAATMDHLILVDTVTTATTATNLTNLPAAAALEATAQSILTDTNELQTDWANGGRLDLILDARSSQTSVDDLPTNSELATALGTADDAVLAAIPSAATVATAVWAKTLP